VAALTGELGEHCNHVVARRCRAFLTACQSARLARAGSALSFHVGEVGAVISNRSPFGSWK
jgi:hypothetical protein